MKGRVDFDTGAIHGEVVHAKRTAGELAHLYAGPVENPDAVVYETHSEAPTGDEPQMLFATTILYPGRVGDEPFMTRGHFHIEPSRGEFMVTLRGTGALLLRNRSGEDRAEMMAVGSIHQVDGQWAHRVINTGDEPLVFLVTWMSDCGHDYASVEAWPNGSWSGR
jgi:glucose-6-phosphate isomerase, archaeal